MDGEELPLKNKKSHVTLWHLLPILQKLAALKEVSWNFGALKSRNFKTDSHSFGLDTDSSVDDIRIRAPRVGGEG